MWGRNVPCSDGGNDDFSAYAGYSGTDSTTGIYAPVDSRLITNEIDLTGYSSAFIEFTEAYGYPEDANDSNMVEVSIDGGQTWDVVYASDPSEVGNRLLGEWNRYIRLCWKYNPRCI